MNFQNGEKNQMKTLRPVATKILNGKGCEINRIDLTEILSTNVSHRKS